MTSPVTPICLYCKHFNRDDDENFTCSAFPDGIPEEIALSQTDHRSPVSGDNGIVFEPKTEKDNTYAAILFDL